MKVKYTQGSPVMDNCTTQKLQKKISLWKIIVFCFEVVSTIAHLLLVFMTSRCTSITDPHSPCFPDRLRNSVMHTCRDLV